MTLIEILYYSCLYAYVSIGFGYLLKKQVIKMKINTYKYEI
jgi:hypothetical protein